MATTFHVMKGQLTSRGLEDALAVFRECPDDCTLGPLLVATAIPLQAWLWSVLRHGFKFVCFSEAFLGPLNAPSTTADVYIDKMAEGPTHQTVVQEIIGQIGNYTIDTGEIVGSGGGTCVLHGLFPDGRRALRIPDAQLAPTQLVPADGNGLRVPRFLVEVNHRHLGLPRALLRATQYFLLPQLRTVLVVRINERNLETGQFGALAVVYARRRNNHVYVRQAVSIGTAALSAEALVDVPQTIQGMLQPHDVRLAALIDDGYLSWPAPLGPAPTITVAAIDIFYRSPGLHLGPRGHGEIRWPDLHIDLYRITAKIAMFLPDRQ